MNFDPVRGSPPLQSPSSLGGDGSGSRPRIRTVRSHASSGAGEYEDASPPPTPQQRAMSINALVAAADSPTLPRASPSTTPTVPFRPSFAVGALLNDDNAEPRTSRKTWTTSPAQAESLPLPPVPSSSHSPSVSHRERMSAPILDDPPRRSSKMSMEDVMNADSGIGSRKRVDPVRDLQPSRDRSVSPARKRQRVDGAGSGRPQHALEVDTSFSRVDARPPAMTPHSEHPPSSRSAARAGAASPSASLPPPTPAADMQPPQSAVPPLTPFSDPPTATSTSFPPPSPAPTVQGKPRRRYQPTQRVSAPTSVRQPISWLEAEGLLGTCRNPLRLRWERENVELAERLREMGMDKPRWGPPEGWDAHAAKVADALSALEKPKAKPKKSGAQRRKEAAGSGDSPVIVTEKPPSMVAAHYNARKDQGMMVRDTSPIIPMRKFNNWIKAVIISRFSRGPGPRQGGGRVLELGCGKGGDLQKWARARPAKVVMIDIAEISVQQARSRFEEGRTKGQIGYDADFYAFDCFHQPLGDHVPREVLEERFDNVSLQFCMHYGWSTPSSARLMLENISRYLRVGGVFVGTIPDAEMVKHRLDMTPPNSLEFGNSIYQVRFKQRGAWPPYGNEYNFLLIDAVDDVPEFVVDWDAFEGFASEFGLSCIFHENFEEVYVHHREDREFGPMLERMVGHDAEGRLRVPSEMWEACTFYKAFAFEKVREAGQPV